MLIVAASLFLFVSSAWSFDSSPQLGVEAACIVALGDEARPELALADSETSAVLAAARHLAILPLARVVEQIRGQMEPIASASFSQLEGIHDEGAVKDSLKTLRDSLSSHAQLAGQGSSVLRTVQASGQYAIGSPTLVSVDIKVCKVPAKIVRVSKKPVTQSSAPLFTQGSSGVSICANLNFSSNTPGKMAVTYFLVHTELDQPVLGENALIKFGDQLPTSESAYQQVLATKLKSALRLMERKDSLVSRSSGGKVLPPICASFARPAQKDAHTLDLERVEEEGEPKVTATTRQPRGEKTTHNTSDKNLVQ